MKKNKYIKLLVAVLNKAFLNKENKDKDWTCMAKFIEFNQKEP